MQYLTFARIARDYFAIQGSFIPSECTFSSGSLTGTRLCRQLMPQIFEALQILKSGYQNRHVGAAKQHYKKIMEVVNLFEDKNAV